MSDPRDPQLSFATNLLTARKAAGITQAELGERCGLHRTEVSLLERAGREPRLETIVKLAAGLETSVEVLCGGISWDPARQRFRAERGHSDHPRS